MQHAPVSCRCVGEGVGPVDERFDPALIPEGENGLEFLAEGRDLPPQVADVDAADGPVVVQLWFISPSGVSSGMPATWEARRAGRRRCPLARLANP